MCSGGIDLTDRVRNQGLGQYLKAGGNPRFFFGRKLSWVRVISDWLGVQSPLGWLWARINANRLVGRGFRGQFAGIMRHAVNGSAQQALLVDESTECIQEEHQQRKVTSLS